LIVQLNNRIGVPGGATPTKIFELDTDTEIRWKIAMQSGYPVDAQVVGGGPRPRRRISGWPRHRA